MIRNLKLHFVALGLLAALATGCATSAAKLSRVYQGMPKEEVVQVLGGPSFVRGDGTLVYALDDGGLTTSDYLVYMTEGRCTGWERAGGPIDHAGRARAAQALTNWSNQMNQQNRSLSCSSSPNMFGGYDTNCKK